MSEVQSENDVEQTNSDSVHNINKESEMDVTDSSAGNTEVGGVTTTDNKMDSDDLDPHNFSPKLSLVGENGDGENETPDDRYMNINII